MKPKTPAALQAAFARRNDAYARWGSRVLRHVSAKGECWETTARRRRAGEAVPRTLSAEVGQRTVSARRALYIAVTRELPPTAKLVSSCGNGACVRPQHFGLEDRDPRSEDLGAPSPTLGIASAMIDLMSAARRLSVLGVTRAEVANLLAETLGDE
jgi:hypothetical protein